jgi:NAD(P)-dependent dehydrogenase (short-subunit alcohol dehydrogenase family)
MTIDLTGRVAIVTGAGAGLGRSHALALAKAGAKVVVNDMAAGPAEAVAAEIVAAGGEALAFAASVSDEAAVGAMVAATVERWDRVDILVNNAGILRDKSFAKMDLADFRLVVDVHLMGSVICTKAVWEVMRTQNYGRIIMTTSGTGLFGNFGQSNYGAAKAGVVGLMQSLAIEGAKNNIHLNSLVPVAATAMTEGVLTPEMLAFVKPEAVSPGVVFLASEAAPTRLILCAGGGSFAAAHITLTPGIYVGTGADAADQLAAHIAAVTDRAGSIVPDSVRVQTLNHIAAAQAAGAEPVAG